MWNGDYNINCWSLIPQQIPEKPVDQAKLIRSFEIREKANLMTSGSVTKWIHEGRIYIYGVLGPELWDYKVGVLRHRTDWDCAVSLMLDVASPDEWVPFW